jgi:hypothetical protein
MNYYTYAYLREDRTPYYIGKGQGNRAYRRSKKDIKPPKDKSRIIFLKQNITEEEAFKHEIYMIAVFGRIDLGTGILHNRTDGGDGVSGYVCSEETKKKISEAKKGKTASEETKRNMSEAHKGRTHSEESRIKMSEAQKGKPVSEETKRKISEARKGKTSNRKGVILSEETKRNMSESHKNPSEETRKKIGESQKGNTNMLGKTHSEETKRKIGEVTKNTKWWNDGCGNRKRMVECPGDDWRIGKK